MDATYTQTDITVFGYDSTCTAKANSTPGSKFKCTPVEAKASSKVSTSVNTECNGKPHTCETLNLLLHIHTYMNIDVKKL